MELRARPLGALDLFGSFGFSHTEFTEFEQLGEDLSGNRFAFAPRVTAAVGGSYFFDNGVEIHADASYTGESFSSVDNSEFGRLDSRFIANALIGYQTDRWGAFLYARNLFDNDYLLERDPIDGETGIAGEPLTVGGYVTLTF